MYDEDAVDRWLDQPIPRWETATDAPTVRLERWSGPWPADDPDANFKADVATYSNLDPLATVRRLGENLDIPVGALVRYVLAKWASGGAEGLLELGPSTVQRLAGTLRAAEAAGTDEARLAAYAQLREVIEWLNLPLDDDSIYGSPAT